MLFLFRECANAGCCGNLTETHYTWDPCFLLAHWPIWHGFPINTNKTRQRWAWFQDPSPMTVTELSRLTSLSHAIKNPQGAGMYTCDLSTRKAKAGESGV